MGPHLNPLDKSAYPTYQKDHISIEDSDEEAMPFYNPLKDTRLQREIEIEDSEEDCDCGECFICRENNNFRGSQSNDIDCLECECMPCICEILSMGSLEEDWEEDPENREIEMEESFSM